MSREATNLQASRDKSRLSSSKNRQKQNSILKSVSRHGAAAVPGAGGDYATRPYKPPVQVVNEFGEDVTPQPLTQFEPSLRARVTGDGSRAHTPQGDFLSQASFYTAAGAGATLSTQPGGHFGGGPFSRSVFASSAQSDNDDMMEPGAIMQTAAWTGVQRKEVQEVVTESDLDKDVRLNLSETNTMWFLDMPGTALQRDTEEALKAANDCETYKLLCASRAGNDLYADRGMNTFGDAEKTKPVQTEPIVLAEVGCWATEWLMYDTWEEEEEKAKKAEVVVEELPFGETAPADGDVDEVELEAKQKITDVPDVPEASSSASVASGSPSGSVSSRSRTSVSQSQRMGSSCSGGSEMAIKVNTTALTKPQLARDLFNMERAVNLNTYQHRQAQYRSLPVIEELLAPDDPALTVKTGSCLDRLWIYSCLSTKARNISCLTWNSRNPNIMAVGYGQFDFTAQKNGLVACWSLKNPEYPERVYVTEQGVTSLDFSKLQPNLLACGFYDGTIAIYNVSSTDTTPVMDSLDVQSRHIGPVWQMRWVAKETSKEQEKAELLISICTDGRIIQWSIRKGFECQELMKMKRTVNKRIGKQTGERKNEALIARYCGGYCFDVDRQDANFYIVGTEDGPIHRCSCSYNEQFLQTYNGHTAAVYKVRYSPHQPGVFLSCSADWSLRLWHEDRATPVITMTSASKQVMDLSWSPISATVFAAVNETAVELWDISVDSLDPLVTVQANTSKIAGIQFTNVAFSNTADNLLVGDSSGNVTVYKVYNMPPPQDCDKLREIMRASLGSQMETLDEVEDEKETTTEVVE